MMPFDFVALLFTKTIALFLGIRLWRILPTAYRLVFLVTLISLVLEIVGKYIATVLHQDNVWVFNIYALVQTIMLGIAGLLYADKTLSRKIIFALLVVLTCFWVMYAINQNIDKLFNWFFVSSAIAMVITYIIVLLDNSLFKQQRIFTQPLFLISISYIIYFGSTIPLFGVMNVLVETDMHVASALFKINQVANIICYALIAIAFYLYGKQAKREHVRQ